MNFIVACDGNRPVQNFTFYVQTGNQSFKFVELDNFPVSTLTLSNGTYSRELMNSRLILPFTFHSVRVVACNVIGCSSQSEASEAARTDEHSKLMYLIDTLVYLYGSFFMTCDVVFL